MRGKRGKEKAKEQKKSDFKWRITRLLTCWKGLVNLQFGPWPTNASDLEGLSELDRNTPKGKGNGKYGNFQCTQNHGDSKLCKNPSKLFKIANYPFYDQTISERYETLYTRF